MKPDQPTDQEMNPYAPPSSEVVGTAFSSDPPAPLPTSSKWAVGCMVKIALGMGIAAVGVIETLGLSSVISDPLPFVAFLSAGLGFVFLLLWRRRAWVYGYTVAILGINGLLNVLALVKLIQAALDSETRTAALPTVILNVTVNLISLLLLFYVFTFGLASRRYYRIAPEPGVQ